MSSMSMPRRFSGASPQVVLGRAGKTRKSREGVQIDLKNTKPAVSTLLQHITDFERLPVAGPKVLKMVLESLLAGHG